MSEKRPSRPGQSSGQYVARVGPTLPVGSTRARSLPVTAPPKGVAAAVPPKVVSPQTQLATAVAQNVVELTGLPKGSKKAKTLAAEVQLSVTKASSKTVSMATLTEVLAKVKGPPPVLQQVLVPFGSLVGVAAKVPNAQVSEQVLLAKFPSRSVLLLVSSLDSCGPARGGVR